MDTTAITVTFAVNDICLDKSNIFLDQLKISVCSLNSICWDKSSIADTITVTQLKPATCYNISLSVRLLWLETELNSKHHIICTGKEILLIHNKLLFSLFYILAPDTAPILRSAVYLTENTIISHAENIPYQVQRSSKLCLISSNFFNRILPHQKRRM